MRHERPNEPQDMEAVVAELTATVHALSKRLDAVESRLLDLRRAECMRSAEVEMAAAQWRRAAIEMTRN